MRLTRVEDIEPWLDQLTWHFQSFCRGGTWEPQDLVEDVIEGTRQLWIVHDDEIKAAILTLLQDDRQRTCVITHVTGSDRGSWMHLLPQLEEEARRVGCKRIEAVARPGWEKVLDWKKTHVVLEKNL